MKKYNKNDIHNELNTLLKDKKKLENNLYNLNADIYILSRQLKLNIGDYECEKSQFGYCAYDDGDYSQDDCIFCHQPDERK